MIATSFRNVCKAHRRVLSSAGGVAQAAALVALVAAAMWALPGCTTQDRSSLAHPWCTERFQECPVRLAEYKPAQQRVGGQDPNLALAVAISGGGHRAGNFGVGVLLGLEELARQATGGGGGALREVDYLSTVSGGGLSAAAYLSSLHDYQHFRGTAEGYSLAEALRADQARLPLDQQCTDPDLRRHLEYNYVDDIIRGMFTIVTAGSCHRGDFLENSFDDHVLGRLWRERKLRAQNGGQDRDASLRLCDVFVPRAAAGQDVRLPYWAANATTYENAAIFPFTPDHLRLYGIRGYTHRLERARADTPPAEDFAYRVPLALGLTASGTFPVLIPAVTLHSAMDPRNPYLHLVDGGLADMFGAVTAVRMLRQDDAGRKALIVVDAFSGPLTPFSNCDAAPAAAITACRVATAFMDAWRARYREVIGGLCSSREPPTDVHVVFLSFDDLVDCRDVRELERFGFGPADRAELQREGLAAGKEGTPFVLARDVRTWYGLSRAEQKLLLAVGRYVVDRKRDEIRRALGWPAEQGEGPKPSAQP